MVAVQPALSSIRSIGTAAGGAGGAGERWTEQRRADALEQRALCMHAPCGLSPRLPPPPPRAASAGAVRGVRRTPHNVGGADDDGVLAAQWHPERVQHVHAAERRAWREQGLVAGERERADILRAKAVDVLLGMDGGEHGAVVHVWRQRQLHDDPVHLAVGVQSAHLLQHLLLRRAAPPQGECERESVERQKRERREAVLHAVRATEVGTMRLGSPSRRVRDSHLLARRDTRARMPHLAAACSFFAMYDILALLSPTRTTTRHGVTSVGSAWTRLPTDVSTPADSSFPSMS
eukprot:155824-Prymnesium_polylepis.1